MGARVERLVWFRWAFVFAVVILGLATFYEPLAQPLPEGLVGLPSEHAPAVTWWYALAVISRQARAGSQGIPHAMLELENELLGD